MHDCPICRNFAWAPTMVATQDRRGLWHHPACPLAQQPVGPHVGFGGVASVAAHSITTAAIVKSGVISFVLTKALGATVPGALLMGVGGALWEAGSGGIPLGWKRYVLGLFQRPGS